tara:strand:+ start:247 stop:987 length:741 start_codon:yes stop_codon:yes gene_type:complete
MDIDKIDNTIARTNEELKNYRHIILSSINFDNVNVNIPNSMETKNLKEWDNWAKDNLDYGNFQDVSVSAMNVIYNLNMKMKTITKSAIDTAFSKVQQSIMNLSNELKVQSQNNINYKDEVDTYLKDIQNRSYQAFDLLINKMDNLMGVFITELKQNPDTLQNGIDTKYNILKDNLKQSMEIEKTFVLTKIHTESEVDTVKEAFEEPINVEEEEPEEIEEIETEINKDDEADMPSEPFKTNKKVKKK